MMFFMTSSVPPATRMPGTPRMNSDQANVPHSPVSAWILAPSVCSTNLETRDMLLVSASLAIDISGPGS